MPKRTMASHPVPELSSAPVTGRKTKVSTYPDRPLPVARVCYSGPFKHSEENYSNLSSVLWPKRLSPRPLHILHLMSLKSFVIHLTSPRPQPYGKFLSLAGEMGHYIGVALCTLINLSIIYTIPNLSLPPTHLRTRWDVPSLEYSCIIHPSFY